MKLILIIDDDADFISSLRLTLESSGYGVISAHSAAEGLALFMEGKPDLIISDIMMEKIDSGIRFARDVRDIDARVPLFLLSDIGRLTAENVDAYRLDCNGLFQKPIHMDKLLERIKEELGSRE